ncbi:MAG: TraR/DksA C4-type zinc finger protein, partial [Opitutales bacterium]|nr:TraR/DksA C4-type zinc finger protein [Opitutales bacterium]
EKKPEQKKENKKASVGKSAAETANVIPPETAPQPEPVPAGGGKEKPQPVKPSFGIYFSLKDLDAYLARRRSAASSGSAPESKAGKASAVAASATPAAASAPKKRPLAVATVFDILGLNPVVAKTHEKLEEKDVPRKWKKYYKSLVELRKHHSKGVETHSQEVLKRSAKDDAGDLSSYGQHLADAGSESFERDMAYNIISGQKEILAEIDEAIKRIKNGTYGICEVTGKPIPESRLSSIPYTRCTKEGQEIKEAEIRRQKASQRAELYDIADGAQGISDDDPSA